MRSRIGQFLLVIGLIALVVFFATIQAGQPSMLALLIGVGSAFLGFFLVISGRKPPEPSERFRLLRSTRDKLGERRDTKR